MGHGPCQTFIESCPQCVLQTERVVIQPESSGCTTRCHASNTKYTKRTRVCHSRTGSTHNELEALRERRPPWPRQIITLILLTVKMLSLGCERLPTPLKKKKKKRFWIITCTTIWVCYHYYGVFCSFTHLARSPPKFNQFFLVLLRTRP